MALTRAQVESLLVQRLKTLLTAAGLSTSKDGTNEDLNDAVGYAARQLGGTVADVTNVTSSELSFVGADDYDKFLDIAELRALETIVNALDDVNVKAGPLSTNQSEYAERAQKQLDKKRDVVMTMYGIGSAQIEAGVITLDVLLKDRDVELVS